MHKGINTRYLLASILCSLALPAAASNFGFMKNTLLSQLSSNDMQQLKTQISTVLEKNPDKKITQWQASESKMTVKILPKLSYTEAGLPCRRTLLNFSAPSQHSETYGFNVCKNTENQWQITQSRLQSLSDEDVSLIESHALQALDSNDIGTPVTWFNPQSQINGTVVLANSTSKNKNTCSTIAISLFDVNGVSLEGQYRLCKTDAGWKREASPRNP